MATTPDTVPTAAAAGPPDPPPRPGALARLADLSFRRRRLVVLAWVAALAVMLVGAAPLAGEFSADYSTPGSESKAASAALAERFPGTSTESVDVVWQSSAGAQGGAPEERVQAFLAQADRLEGIGTAAGEPSVSRDGTIALTRLPLTVQRADEVPAETGESLIALAERTGGEGLRIELGGQVIEQAQQAELSSEVIGFGIAGLILLVTFGSMVAAGLPLLTALFGLGIGTSAIGLLAAVMDVPDWATTVAAMVGIGVGIDYALLVITRYRSALAAGTEARPAIVEAISTAGRSVLVAGTTVVISMLGLFLMGLTYLNGVALSTSATVLVVMAAAVTLLPALLGMLGHRVDRLRIPGVGRSPRSDRPTAAARWSDAVARRPWVAVAAGVLVVAALTVPIAQYRLGFPDAGNDAADTTTRQAYDLASEGFGAGASGPLVLVAASGDETRLRALGGRVAAVPGVASVTSAQVNPAGDTAMLTVTPTTSPQSPATEDLVERLRDDVLPQADMTVDVGGVTASTIDQGTYTASRLPLFIGGVVGLSFLLLTAVFRAPLVALKAAALNLGSIGAAYGVVALVADGGWAGQLVGIDTPTPVPAFIPVMMFAVLFGLSMDYEVFLLSRIREEFLRTRDAGLAVREGLARTARVITAAAAIMVAVFAAFAISDEVFIKLIGIGLATAILVDASIVRLLLAPAIMNLLGARTWWLPRWLDRVLPHVDVEGESAPAERHGGRAPRPALDGASA